MKSGYISLIGRPNTGKSTLLNAIVNMHLAITSDKPGTTRNIIEGIYNDDDSQIIFIDTPGIHKPMNKLGKVLNKQAESYVDEVDAVLFLVDASVPMGKGDHFIMDSLFKKNIPVILVLNKIDKISEEQIMYKINEYKDEFEFAEIIPISALKKDNTDRLIKIIKKYLTDSVRYFDPEMVTNNSTSFIVSEYVREKLLAETEDEIPHRITCVTTSYKEKKNIVEISVDIIVDRDSLKKIIIGKNGERLKLVGTKARKDIEKLVDKKVYLELYVKTISSWREKDKYLNELGFKNFE